MKDAFFCSDNSELVGYSQIFLFEKVYLVSKSYLNITSIMSLILPEFFIAKTYPEFFQIIMYVMKVHSPASPVVTSVIMASCNCNCK